MTDIAALGLSVDSAQVESATGKLDQFTTASRRAERATKTFETGNKAAATSAGALAAAVQKATTSAEIINKRLNVRDTFGGKDRAADIEVYGRQLDDLRAKFNPLFAAERNHLSMVNQIAAAQLVGALSQTEASLAVLASESDYKRQAAAIQAANAQLAGQAPVLQANTQQLAGNTKGAALSAQAMANLSFQINDVATQAALGMDPLRILAAQGGQFYQIFSQGEGGVRGSLGYIGSLVRGLLTPFRLAVGGAVSLAAAGVYAATSWRSAQQDIRIAFIGTGSAAGVTADEINRIANESARTGKSTVGDARDMALAFAATGRISSDLTERLLRMSKGFGLLYGETATEGAARLAKAFADPARGVDELNKRLAAFDAATVQSIKSLAEQGRYLEAQKLLLNGVQTATEQASAQTNGWANAWGRLKAAASDYWAAAGRSIDGMTGGGNTVEKQLADAEDRLRYVQRRAQRGGSGIDPGEVSRASAEVKRLADQLERANAAAADAPGKLRSIDYAEAIDAATPNLRALTAATDQLEILKKSRLDASGLSGLTEMHQAGLDRAIKARAEEVASIKTKIQYEKTALEIAQEEHAFSLQSINARTAAQRAEIAYQQTLARERREGNTSAEYVAAAAKAQVLAEENRNIADEIRTRNFAAKQAVDLAALELSLVGKTADEAARITAAFEARQQVQTDAFQSFRRAGAGELAEAERLAQQKVDYESRTRRAKIMADLEFERAQKGRSSIEGSVYERMQTLGLLTNGQIVGAQNEAIAAQIRLNEQMQRSIDIQREFASGFLRDMMAGKSATEALGNSLESLAQKALDNSVNHFFAGVSQMSGVQSGGLFGGNILPGILHAGGVVGNDNYPTRSVPASLFAGARRYHNGGMIGADEVPAILQKGERVLSRAEVAAGGSGGGVVVPLTVNIDARGAYPESIQEIKSALNQIPAQVVGLVRDARSRKIA